MLMHKLSPTPAPDTPSWLVIPVFALVISVMVIMLALSFVLERRWTGPYSLRARASQEKWRWALILSLLRFGWVPLLPALSPLPGEWPTFPIYCLALWVILLVPAVLVTRWSFEIQLSRYRRIDKAISKGTFSRVLTSPFMSWITWSMTEEHKRFFEEGYPDEPET